MSVITLWHCGWGKYSCNEQSILPVDSNSWIGGEATGSEGIEGTGAVITGPSTEDVGRGVVGIG